MIRAPCGDAKFAAPIASWAKEKTPSRPISEREGVLLFAGCPNPVGRVRPRERQASALRSSDDAAYASIFCAVYSW
jgi:hypothetical protein